MDRTLRDSRNIPLHHRRVLTDNSKDSSGDDINLDDLFSKCRRSVSLASSDESDALSVKLGRLSIGSVKQGKSGLEDLLSSADGGKHDYDWLLTPPGTPLVPSSDENGIGNQQRLTAPRTGPSGRSISTTKLSASQSENSRTTKPTRSSSVTRPSVSNSQYSTYSNKSTSVLNTSSASVSSYIRPSTPTRSSSITRPSTPSSRPTLSRSTTPSKPRSVQTSYSVDKPRPSTPSSRPQITTNLSSPAPRTITSSRPSTPTRRSSAPSLSPVSGPSTPGGRTISNGRVGASLSRPSSPGPRVRPTTQPVAFQDFSLETPPNLRTSLPDRPLSAGRSRPGSSVTAKGNIEHVTNNTSTVPRRQSSPVVTRGRVSELNGRSRTPVKAQQNEAVDTRRELSTRKPLKASSESTGFGRTISKKSLDMAIRHMDIRSSGNGVRPLTGSNIFPHSIRSSSNQKSQRRVVNGVYSENIDHLNRFSESGSEEDKSQSSAKLTDIDMYESSRYDMILLKEDLKNADWLRSLDDKSDQGPVFDNGFELLPEPFDAL